MPRKNGAGTQQTRPCQAMPCRRLAEGPLHDLKQRKFLAGDVLGPRVMQPLHRHLYLPQGILFVIQLVHPQQAVPTRHLTHGKQKHEKNIKGHMAGSCPLLQRVRSMLFTRSSTRTHRPCSSVLTAAARIAHLEARGVEAQGACPLALRRYCIAPPAPSLLQPLWKDVEAPGGWVGGWQAREQLYRSEK